MTDCTDEDLKHSLFACFSAFLTTEIPSSKRPINKWRKSLRRDLTTATENTGRVFFESGGAQAWAAYEAVRPAKVHRQGQTNKRHRFAQLHRQSLEFKADLARMVATVAPHPTVADLISPMGAEARTIFARPVDPQPSLLGNSAPSKRRRTDEYPQEPSTWPVAPPPTPPATRHHETTLPAVGGHNRGQIEGHTAGQTERQTERQTGRQTEGKTAEVDEVKGAHIQGLIELVSPYMVDAIRKYSINGTLKAGVRMLFPEKDLDMPCAITFDIMDQKVEFLAEKLFNAHLEREGMFRLLYYDGDARKGRVSAGFTLMCCTTEAIPRLFGRLITAGNAASPHRHEEARAGLCGTQTVTMELREVGEGALISLSLGRREGSQIFEKLYPR